MCKYINHTLHASYGRTNEAVLNHANARISYHFNRGTIGPATIFYFQFKTKEYVLLSLLIIQKLDWLATISSAWRSVQWPNMRRNVHLSTFQIFLDRITKNHLIPTLRKFGKFSPLRTIEGSNRTRSLFI